MGTAKTNEDRECVLLRFQDLYGVGQTVTDDAVVLVEATGELVLDFTVQGTDFAQARKRAVDVLGSFMEVVQECGLSPFDEVDVVSEEQAVEHYTVIPHFTIERLPG
jgi:hypothetical protein